MDPSINDPIIQYHNQLIPCRVSTIELQHCQSFSQLLVVAALLSGKGNIDCHYHCQQLFYGAFTLYLISISYDGHRRVANHKHKMIYYSAPRYILWTAPMSHCSRVIPCSDRTRASECQSFVAKLDIHRQTAEGLTL